MHSCRPFNGLKRKCSHSQLELADDRDTPARPPLSINLRKRLFDHKRRRTTNSTPTDAPDMSELVQFILAHEEAFQSRGRLASLYADFRSQVNTNPEGYAANLNVWKKALTHAGRVGVLPAPGSTHSLLTIHTGAELARALQHKDYGMPTCLPAVFQDAIKKREFISVKDFKNSPTSIYRTSWVPSLRDVLQWGWTKLAGPGDPDKLPVGDFVVVQNIELAAEEILNQVRDQLHTSNADRILSKPAFMKRFSRALNTNTPLTVNDLDILLIHMARDKEALSFSDRTIKFKAETEAVPTPVTSEDSALAELHDSMEKINAQLPILHEKIVALDLTAREAVKAKQMVRAKTALRSKKLAESVLAQRSALALQLEEAYMKLQQAVDQVDIIEAMKAGAEAMGVLNQRVGGVEGVQNVMDSVNEQMNTVDEITSIINESGVPIDEGEVDDEFEALERAEKERKEQEEAAKTAARLAELEEAEVARRKKEEDAVVEEKVQEASTELSQLSVESDEKEERIPIAS